MKDEARKRLERIKASVACDGSLGLAPNGVSFLLSLIEDLAAKLEAAEQERTELVSILGGKLEAAQKDTARLAKLATFNSFECDRRGNSIFPEELEWDFSAYTDEPDGETRNWSGDGPSIQEAIDNLPDAARQAEEGKR